MLLALAFQDAGQVDLLADRRPALGQLRQEDFAVGVPIANRQLASTENLIGTFVNMLVLRADMTGEPTFLQLLQRVQAATLEAYAHQDMPFEKLVAEMQLDRDMSHSPLFQIMLDYINVPSPKISMDGLEGDNVGVNRHSSKFDMGLIVVDTAQLQSLELEYNTDLFDEATAVRFLDNLETLLEAIVAKPHSSIAELSVLAAAERKWVLEAWNKTEMVYPREQCLHQLIEAQVEQVPGKTAVIFQDQTITYQALNQRAEQMAHQLRQLGVGPDVIVGICLERSIEMMVSLLAVLKAGGAYLPLDPAYPLDRLSYMLADAQSPVLITESSLNLTEALTKYLPQAIHVYLAKSAAALVTVQLEDMIGMREPVNIPGTSSEYSNWMRRMTASAAEIFARDDVRALCVAMTAGRGA